MAVNQKILKLIKESFPGLYLGNYAENKFVYFLAFKQEDVSLWIAKIGLEELKEKGEIMIYWEEIGEFDLMKIWKYYNTANISLENDIRANDIEYLVIEKLAKIKMGIKKFVILVESNTEIRVIHEKE